MHIARAVAVATVPARPVAPGDPMAIEWQFGGLDPEVFP